MAIIVKLHLPKGDKYEIRRFTVDDAASLSFEELKTRVGKISPDVAGSSMEMYWKDADDDLILFSSDEELQEAIRSTKRGTLRVFIEDANKKPRKGTEKSQRNVAPSDERADVAQSEKKIENTVRKNKDDMRMWKKLISAKREDALADGKPFWAPYMARSMRQCAFHAWICAQQKSDAEPLKPKDVPEEYRKWMRHQICTRITKAEQEWKTKPSLEEDSGEDLTSIDEVMVGAEDDKKGKPFQQLPLFWRRNIRHFTKEALKHASNKDGSDLEHFPDTLRKVMRKIMIRTWNCANGNCKNSNVQKRKTDKDADPKQWKQLMKPDECKAAGLPLWAPYMTKAMRRCSFKAWIRAHESKDATDEATKLKKVPLDFRKWMRLNVSNAVVQASKEWEEKKVTNESGSQAADEDEVMEPKMKNKLQQKIENVPMFWRQNIRELMQEAWKQAAQAENAGNNDGDVYTHKIPADLRQFMRQVMVRSWCRANAAANVLASQDEVEPMEISKQNEASFDIPETWSSATSLCVLRASLVAAKILTDGAEFVDKEQMTGSTKMAEKIEISLLNDTHSFVKNRVEKSWKNYQQKQSLFNVPDNFDKDKSTGGNEMDEIPLPWRRAMRCSMRQIWLRACSQTSENEASSDPNKGEGQLPEFWKKFMKSNMTMAWRDAHHHNSDISTSDWEGTKDDLIRSLKRMHIEAVGASRYGGPKPKKEKCIRDKVKKNRNKDKAASNLTDSKNMDTEWNITKDLTPSSEK